jgi:hypothetical protein
MQIPFTLYDEADMTITEVYDHSTVESVTEFSDPSKRGWRVRHFIRQTSAPDSKLLKEYVDDEWGYVSQGVLALPSTNGTQVTPAVMTVYGSVNKGATATMNVATDSTSQAVTFTAPAPMTGYDFVSSLLSSATSLLQQPGVNLARVEIVETGPDAYEFRIFAESPNNTVAITGFAYEQGVVPPASPD